MVADCSNECVPQSYLGDGYCDRGTRGVNFDCAQKLFDGGDCKDSSAGAASLAKSPASLSTITNVANTARNNVNAYTGQSYTTEIFAIMLLLLCCGCRSYYRRKQQQQQAPSWSKINSNVQYLPADKDMESHGASAEVEGGDDHSSKPTTPSYSQFKEEKERQNSPQKAGGAGAFWESQNPSAEDDLDFDEVMAARDTA